MAWRCLTKQLQVATHLSDFGQVKNSLARSFPTKISVPGHSNIRNTSYNQRCLNFWKSAKHDKDAKDLNDLTRKQVTTEAALLGTKSNPIRFVQIGPLKHTTNSYICYYITNIFIIFLILFGIQDIMGETGMFKIEDMRFMIQPIIESDTKFSDVKGVDEAKAELEEIVHYLRNPKKFTRLGGKLPKGVLLVGAPGNGKTMLARAVAGEARVPFFYCSGSEFDKKYFGVGAKRVREIFAAAREYAPCIVFIDEIDRVGGKRMADRCDRMTLNQLLVEVDGFKQNEGIVLIGATNHPNLLDKALTRAGRFDRHVTVHYPDVKGRRQIIESYLSKVVKGDDVNTMILAGETPGFSGAELSNMVNIAAVKAAMDGAKAVSMNDLEYAKDKISMGSERKSAVMSMESRLNTAFCEAGHALVAMYTEGGHPIEKATIVPRMVTQLPDMDRCWNSCYCSNNRSKIVIKRKRLLARLDVLMGGRAAEEFIFGENEVTSGASSDLQKATTLAKRMVTEFGMNNEVGNVTHNYINGGRNMSSETKFLIEKEVKQYLEKAYSNAKTILTSHDDELHAIAEALMEKETLTGSEIRALVTLVKLKKQKKVIPKMRYCATIARRRGIFDMEAIARYCAELSVNSYLEGKIILQVP